MKSLNWEDLQIFYHVAESGGLSGATDPTGLSAATIGRRMLALEQKTGQTLFHRSQSGYRLTRAGEALQSRVRAMRAAAMPVHEFLTEQAETPIIRLTAGTGTVFFLSDNISRLVRRDDGFRLNFLTTETTLDIAHREADLGIRNRPAQAGNLASRRLATLRFVPYRSWTAQQPDQLEWVGMDPAFARHPATHWLNAQDVPVRFLANSVATVHQLVRAGAGIGIMPCMIGDRDPALARAGPIIQDLTEDQYLVMHADDRHRPQMRRLIDRIVALYRDSAALLAGEQPIRDFSPDMG